MKSHAHAEAFSKTLAKALLDFKTAVEVRNKSEAHIQYALACGLIGGAALSGGVSKDAGRSLLITLEETRVALMTAFGDAPNVAVPSIN